MPETDTDHHVFVDFENVPTVNLELVATLPVAVTLLIGEKQKKMDLAFVRQIHRHASKVELIEVGASGHNALDLVLACHLGKAAVRHPERRYYIVSRDKDFNPLVAHLRADHIDVSRHDSFDALPFFGRRTGKTAPASRGSTPSRRAARDETLPTVRPDVVPSVPVAVDPVAPNPEAPERLAKLIDRLQRQTKARPVRRKTLLSHIKAFYGNALAPDEVAGVVETLIGRGLIAIDDRDRVTYP